RLLEDRLEPAVRAGAGRYSVNLLEVIDRALAVQPEQRFPSVPLFQAALEDDSDDTIILGPLLKTGRRLGQEPKKPPSTPLFVTSTPKAFDGDRLAILPPLKAPQGLADKPQPRWRWPVRSIALRARSWQANRAAIGGSLLATALAVLAAGWWGFARIPPEESALSGRSIASPRSGESAVLPPAAVEGDKVSMAEPLRPAPLELRPAPLASGPSVSATETATASLPAASSRPESAAESAPSASATAPSAIAYAPQPSGSPEPVPAERAVSQPQPTVEPSRQNHVAVTESSSAAPLAAQPDPLEQPKPTVEMLPRQDSQAATELPPVAPPVPAALPHEAEGASTPDLTAATAPVTPAERPISKPDVAGGAAEPTGTSRSASVGRPQTDSAARLPLKPAPNASRTRPRAASAAQPARTARRAGSRKPAQTQVGRIEAEPSSRENPPKKANVGNPWESPTSTGFNQK
ncbi:MAG: hypothetical protein JNM60_06215, partial [Candidatus Competibacteraceae bacterium]|nr:hypothetical protein [Candidatus Competibacteraceae bacterium]